MSLLEQVTDGTMRVPDLMVVYGPPGVGKTTFASKAPKPLILDIEGGAKRIKGVPRYGKARTIHDVFALLNELYEKPHGYETLVIDSLSELESWIWKQTCIDEGVANIEQIGGGFSKGYIVALKYWDLLKQGINNLQEKRGMNVIMVAHAEGRTFTDPATQTAYDRYQIKLDKKAAALIYQWVDFVGFANFVTYTKGKENALKHKAYSTGARLLYTERRPAYDAKNRLGLPLEMEFQYELYAAAANADPAIKAQQIRENIEEMLKDSADDALKAKVRETVAKAADNTTDLMLIQERVRSRTQKEESNVPAAASSAQQPAAG